MLAYNSDPIFRAKFLDLIKWHREHDAIAQGFGYGGITDGKFRGCAVGCSLRSLDVVAGRESTSFNAHDRYETELGIPRVLARLEDRLFESLPHALAMKWPLRFSSAIRAGADLSIVWPRFALWLLADPADGVIRFARTDRVREAIVGVAQKFEHLVGGIAVSQDEWRKVRSDAYASAYAASAYAAYAAADAYAYADAAAASASAYAASAYAYAASAYAYAASAYAAARSSSYVRQADKLIELLEAA